MCGACSCRLRHPNRRRTGSSADWSRYAVNGYEYVDEHSVVVRVGANRRYVLSTEWNSRDLNWEHVIAIRSTTSWICTGAGLGVEIIGGEPRRHYPVSSIAHAPDQSSPPPAGS